jgi:hypothetical protein
MDLQSRRDIIIKELLNLKNVEVFNQIESLLKIGNNPSSQSPMSMEDLSDRIDKSMADSMSDKVKTSEDLLNKYRKWS